MSSVFSTFCDWCVVQCSSLLVWSGSSLSKGNVMSFILNLNYSFKKLIFIHAGSWGFLKNLQWMQKCTEGSEMNSHSLCFCDFFFGWYRGIGTITSVSFSRPSPCARRMCYAKAISSNQCKSNIQKLPHEMLIRRQGQEDKMEESHWFIVKSRRTDGK